MKIIPRKKGSTVNIERLFFYPIKSCAGIESKHLALRASGPKWDRMFVLVDGRGMFLSQRAHPRMALIRTELGISLATLHPSAIFVSAHGMERHPIPLSGRRLDSRHDFRVRTITIHNDTCRGVGCGDRHSAWFSTFLKHPCRLVRQVSSLPRVKYVSSLGRKIKVSYADGYPLLVTTVESLDDLNRRIAENGGTPVPMERFRPNIVIGGCDAYDEDVWKSLRIGDVLLEVASNSVRYTIAGTDQKTAERTREPLATLATYRKSDKGVEFGRNFAVLARGYISVGNSVTAS